NHASWMVKKVMSAKLIVDQVQQVQNKGKEVLRHIYYHMKGEQQRPAWTCLMFNNAKTPKAYFTMCTMMNQKLAILDRLTHWGVVVDKEAVGEVTRMDRSTNYCSIGMGAVSAMVYSTWEREELISTNVQDSTD
ncbi:hypothetical protein EJD97_018351, partial [Solanum chilense]